ncbi:MAG TPA: helix-turn-helix transcriptional regulator [Allosphingosinicella sp.]|jgi:transcriptional regulator with XRE-family HTH domain
MSDYPNRIRELRAAKSLSQDALAIAVGCSKPQISDLERGNIQLTVEWMRRIAPALGVMPADLLTLKDNPLHLSDAEREIIARYRAATPDQQRSVERVTEALIPYRTEDAASAA